MTTLLEAAGQLRARKVSSHELVTESLARIRDLNPKLNAFLTVMEESALAAARQADQELAAGKDRGPLHGIPVALKDNFYTKGVRTTDGSKLFTDYIPDHDSAVAEKLHEAGAVTVGKTTMHELAYGITSNNLHFGTVHNPHHPDRIPGGSSGGSGAAVQSGMVFMAMGSDTGGSVRIPAAYCGTVGLKPTFGRVSRFGMFPLGYSLDHAGPLTRTCQDAVATLNAISGYDPRDPSATPRPAENIRLEEPLFVKDLKIGVPENFFFERIEPAVDQAVKKALAHMEAQGATLIPVKVPDIAAINTAGRIILLAEASAWLESYHLNRRADISPEVVALLDQGRMISGTQYINAQRVRRNLTRDFAQIWKKVGVLATPTIPMGAPPIGAATVTLGGTEEDTRIATTRFVRPINVLGVPAVSVPCGMTPDNLPIGIQIIGPPFGERKVMTAGALCLSL
ncbi:MAG TPA: amidase [Bryobacteraceae bacterium]|jgi:aspartyl-tRNA(Asn)/glutamyl-tRNA(Gln) amidotransferase subunit A